MAVPLAVRPAAPSGAQYAPGWTTRAGGVVRAGAVWVGAGARVVCVVMGWWVALRVARGCGDVVGRGVDGDGARVGADAAAVVVTVGGVVSLPALEVGAAHPVRMAVAARMTSGRTARSVPTNEKESLMKASGPTALLIPCPWSGDENDPAGASYRLWFWLYRTTRVLRHRFGAHDWRREMTGSGMKRCTWCGARRRADRE